MHTHTATTDSKRVPWRPLFVSWYVVGIVRIARNKVYGVWRDRCAGSSIPAVSFCPWVRSRFGATMDYLGCYPVIVLTWIRSTKRARKNRCVQCLCLCFGFLFVISFFFLSGRRTPRSTMRWPCFLSIDPWIMWMWGFVLIENTATEGKYRRGVPFGFGGFDEWCCVQVTDCWPEYRLPTFFCVNFNRLFCGIVFRSIRSSPFQANF